MQDNNTLTRNDYLDKKLSAEKKVSDLKITMNKIVEEIYTKHEFKDFYDYYTLVNHFGIYNAILLFKQPIRLPNGDVVRMNSSSCVYGYFEWQRKGNQVKRNSSALTILTPFSSKKWTPYESDIHEIKETISSVFDISQTDKNNSKDFIQQNQLKTDIPSLLSKYERFLFSKSIEVQYIEKKNDKRLLYFPSYINKKGIVIRSELSPEEKIARMIYEYLKILFDIGMKLIDENDKLFILESVLYSLSKYFDFKYNLLLDYKNINKSHLMSNLIIVEMMFKKFKEQLELMYINSIAVNETGYKNIILDYLELEILFTTFPKLTQYKRTNDNKRMVNEYGKPITIKIPASEIHLKQKKDIIFKLEEYNSIKNIDILYKNKIGTLKRKINTLNDAEINETQTKYINDEIFPSEQFYI